MKNELKTKSCEEIMTTVYKPLEFVVGGLLAQGLYILAGAPKVGKSWLVLDMCLSIAKGESVLGRETTQGSALYLCLEDSYSRIQNRLYELTDEPSESLYFSVLAESIGNGLEEQIEQFKLQHSDLKIVAIDTLQKIKTDEEYRYGSDYAELTVLKRLAEKLNICILLVHHTRKNRDSDPFNMISGTTGISGCVDGSLVLMKSKRTNSTAKLFATGRDIRECEIHLERDECKWIATDVQIEKPVDRFPFAIHDLIMNIQTFKGSATELCEKLKSSFGGEYFPNRVTRELFRHAYELRGYGISFEHKRSNGQRILKLSYSADSDGSDGKKLIPAQLKVIDPTVTVQETEPLKNIENTGSSENDKISEGDGNLQNSDGKTDLGDGKTSEKTHREKGGNKPRKSRRSKPKSKKGARRKARRRAKNKR